MNAHTHGFSVTTIDMFVFFHLLHSNVDLKYIGVDIAGPTAAFHFQFLSYT